LADSRCTHVRSWPKADNRKNPSDVAFRGKANSAVRAQQSTMPVIGFLRSTPLTTSLSFVAAFRQGLREAGFNEGQNVAIEFRSAAIRLIDFRRWWTSWFAGL
jgi:hypothetical protein